MSERGYTEMDNNKKGWSMFQLSPLTCFALLPKSAGRADRLCQFSTLPDLHQKVSRQHASLSPRLHFFRSYPKIEKNNGLHERVRANPTPPLYPQHPPLPR